MKARVKATGKLVEVHTCDDSDFVDREGNYYWEHQLFFGSLDTFPYEDPDYWTRLEHTYAGMAMQGILSNYDLLKFLCKEGETIKDTVINSTIIIAHALVEELKGKEERK